ncbi:MAG: NAD(P)H-binding protein, partial [Parvularculaceae bacterium]
MRVLVLGGYGLIGAEITRALLKDGFKVTGLGRDAGFGRRLLPEADWIGADIARLTAPVDWLAHLAGVDAVVNAAGALQDSPRDRLAAVHHMSIVACRDAMEKIGVRRFVQISAVGASVSASTEFMSTKALGDAVVKASSLDWVIVRPGLVIGRGAYGGTALLRMLAGFPLMTPLVHASARMQTVSIDDVTAAVGAALKGEVASR